MSLLGRMVQAAKGISSGGPMLLESSRSPLPHMAQWENSDAFSVVPIKNGFLICRRVYNPNGPDSIEATFAASAEDLGPMLIAELATARLKK